MAWLSGWSYRRQITISASQVDETLTDFPLRVGLSGTDVAGSQASGNDIRFTADDGSTLLDHTWTGFTEDGWSGAFVKVPSIDLTSDTTIYLYYGNVMVADASNAAGVWADYAFVHHLDNYDSGQPDSASGYPLYAVDNPVATDGIVGGGVKLKPGYLQSDANADALAGQLGSVAGFGISMLVKNVSTNADGIVFRLRNIVTDSDDGINMVLLTQYFPQLTCQTRCGNGTLYATPAKDITITNGDSAHLAFNLSVDGSHFYSDVFYNGQVGNYSSTGDTTLSTLNFSGGGNDYLRLGWNSVYSINAIVDEVRIRKVPTSAAWLKFEYANLMSAGGEMTLAEQENLSTVEGPYWAMVESFFQTDLQQAETFIPGIIAGHTYGS